MSSDPEAAELARWQQLVDGSPESAALLEAVAASDVTSVAAMGRLRKHGDAALIATAIELVRARAKAARKFPDMPGIVADVAGVEQATSLAVARHKARRFGASLPPDTPVLDLCCGIGGDAMAIAAVADVTAVDSNPVRAWMTERNAGCPTRCADVERMDIADLVFHLDPARRTEAGGRVLHYADYTPGPKYIERLLARCPDGAIKLGPGVDFDELPLGPDREIEVISESGSLVQAVLWCGRLARNAGQRTATRLPHAVSFTADPGRIEAGSAGDFEDYLLLADPAIERADLTGALCRDLPVREVHPGLGILTSTEPVDSPWLTRYAVLAQLPWRPKRVARWLSENDGGLVTVRTRDKTIDCDKLQKQLRGKGDQPYTVFGLRLGLRVVGVIAREVS